MRRRHLERSGRRAPDDGGPHLSSRGAQSVFETILPAQPAAVRLLALFIEVRASQHGEQVVRPGECQGVHHSATNKHCYAGHYLRISAGMSPCLISMSLVAMARATSTTTMPTSRCVKSSFGGLPLIAILPSRAYPAARPETTALWYSALASILPSVAGVVMVLFHIVGVGASLQLGILDFGLGACRRTGAKAHVFARKVIRK